MRPTEEDLLKVNCPHCDHRVEPEQFAIHEPYCIASRKFACHICRKRFGHSGTLATHLKIHDPERKFVCQLCPLKFTMKNDLNQHVKYDHGVVAETHTCELCYHEFKMAHRLRDHLKKVHNIPADADDDNNPLSILASMPLHQFLSQPHPAMPPPPPPPPSLRKSGLLSLDQINPPQRTMSVPIPRIEISFPDGKPSAKRPRSDSLPLPPSPSSPLVSPTLLSQLGLPSDRPLSPARILDNLQLSINNLVQSLQKSVKDEGVLPLPPSPLPSSSPSPLPSPSSLHPLHNLEVIISQQMAMLNATPFGRLLLSTFGAGMEKEE